MATKFGRIDSAESSFEEQTFHKGQTLTSASVGTNHVFGLEDSYVEGSDDLGGGLLNASGSHWAFIHTMFYSSGSTKISQSNPDEIDKFNSIYHNFNQYNDLKPYYNSKFYETASIFYIPQATFGERIQPGSFQLTGRTGSISNTTKEIIIKDDSAGNLYSTNAAHSQSAHFYTGSGIDTGSGDHLSSSANYIGNIFYDLGVAVITETGSWSGSVDYTDIGTEYITDSLAEKDYRYWILKFNSTTPIFTSQYSIKISAGEFNSTMNATTKLYNGGDYIPSGSSLEDVANLKNDLTGSGWSPYINQIHLHRNQPEEPVIVANLPRPVKTRDDIDLIITFRLDH